MKKRSWIVHKFGGTSLADAACFARVAEILARTADQPQAVVVSAVRGVTDKLLELVQLARERNDAYLGRLDQLQAQHQRLAAELLEGDPLVEFQRIIDRERADLLDVLRATAVARHASPTHLDLVSGYGELWSAQLLSALLDRAWGGEDTQGTQATEVQFVDARQVITVEPGELSPVVDWARSQENLGQQVARDFNGTLVVTGFVAAGRDGVQRNLGRNGSDYSASIFGALLDAQAITIWTDVSGVMSADPRLVPEVSIIPALSYNEAMELAYFGAKVLHPQTMAPAIDRSIPIHIRNTFEQEAPGTTIGPAAKGDGESAIKGITTIDGIALINIEGSGMIGVPGTAQRVFGALGQAEISVVMISQGSSEHSICIAVPENLAARAHSILSRAFSVELAQKQIHSITLTPSCSILAVVGDNMAGTPGLAGKVFSSLGKAGINVRAVAQGASERNISAVIDTAEQTRALRAVHSGFYLSPQTISIGLLGPGTVGGVLLDQLGREAQRLAQHCNLRLRAIATSRGMLLEDRSIDPATWRASVASLPTQVDLDRFAGHVQADHLPHAVIIDCTADAAVAQRHAAWLARGIHVITANKLGCAGEWSYYASLQSKRREGGAHYLYETTVGAGLPIIQTLRDLRLTGDEIHSVQGILSGTLAYLFNVFDGEEAFSKIVGQAKEKGYTEPDPREDLSGMDVARKLVIVGREMGLRLELSDVAVDSLVPEPLRAISVDEFLAQLPAYDAAMAERLALAQQHQQVLRYVGRVDSRGRAKVSLESVDRSHPLANIALTDNLVQFETARYNDNPLIVQGPGAGPAVTAGGVFADLLRLAAYLGARL